MEVRIIDREGNVLKCWNSKTDAIGRNRLYKLLIAGDLVAMEACTFAHHL